MMPTATLGFWRTLPPEGEDRRRGARRRGSVKDLTSLVTPKAERSRSSGGQDGHAERDRQCQQGQSGDGPALQLAVDRFEGSARGERRIADRTGEGDRTRRRVAPATEKDCQHRTTDDRRNGLRERREGERVGLRAGSDREQRSPGD